MSEISWNGSNSHYPEGRETALFGLICTMTVCKKRESPIMLGIGNLMRLSMEIAAGYYIGGMTEIE
jgi:hypothetical protein